MSLRTGRVPTLVLGSVLAGAAVLGAGCSAEIDGSARAGDAGAAEVRPLGEMLLDPAAFPAGYPAVVLPPQAVSQAAPDLTGIPPGARVDPAGCKPPAQDYGPDGTVMVVGTDAAKRATVTIELIRVTSPLAELTAQLTDCPEVTTTRNGVVATVTTALVPPPPIDADDTLALRRAVRSGSGEQTVNQSMLTLVAQIGDVRVQATAMSFGADVDDAETDTEVLDGLFTSAVQKVRAS